MNEEQTEDITMLNKIYAVLNESESIKEAFEEYFGGSEYNEETELLLYKGKYYYLDQLDVVGCPVDSLDLYKLMLEEPTND